MSGNYVQRGEPAIFPKDIRVDMALKNGADIILELPFVYATSSAESFASNAVKILDSFGCDKIAFGAESADFAECCGFG
jgi:predicted nucleotidyltransferase